jgi:hypothetical protein
MVTSKAPIEIQKKFGGQLEISSLADFDVRWAM